MRVWSLSKQDNTFRNSTNRRRTTDATSVPRTYDASQWKGGSCERMASKQDENRSTLEHKVCFHDERHSIEVQVPSLFQANAASWVRIVNGVDKYVTESMLTKEEEDIASGKPIAKVRPRQKPSVSILVREREWIDIETRRSHDQKCFEVSKAFTRLLRHDQTVLRGSDGAIQCNDIIEECRKKKFDGASQLSLEDWISTQAKGGGGGAKKRFQHCLKPNSSNQLLYLRAIQGQSGENAADPEVQDNVLLSKLFTEYIFHVGNATELNSIIRNGLIPWGKRGRQAVFFSTVSPMEDVFGLGETPGVLTKPRIAPHKKYGMLVQFEARSRERLAIFTRHMQSFSTPHYL